MQQQSYTTTQTWADGVTPDLILHIVDGDWLGEPEDSCLWSTIGTPVSSPLDAGGYRSHVDDIASHLLLPPLHAFRRRKIKGRWFATDLWSHRRHTHCTERINTGQTCKIFIEKKKLLWATESGLVYVSFKYTLHSGRVTHLLQISYISER